LQFYTIEKEKLENTKGVFGSRNPKDSQHTGQKKMTKGQTLIYKAVHRKLDLLDKSRLG
jgi:hypothetical protein